MTNIIALPLINQMTLLTCDECKEIAINLYINDDFSCIAYRCIACGFVGYFGNTTEDEEDE